MGVQSWPAGTLALPPCSAPSLGVFLITVLRGSGRWLDGVPAVSRVLSLLLQLPVSSLHGLQSFSVSLLVLFAILLQKSSSGSELMTVWTCSLSTASLAWSDSSSMHFSAQTTSLVSMVSTTESLVDGSTTTTSNLHPSCLRRGLHCLCFRCLRPSRLRHQLHPWVAPPGFGRS